MTDTAPELPAWVVDNYCSYDIAPIVELREGDRTVVGFELVYFPKDRDMNGGLR